MARINVKNVEDLEAQNILERLNEKIDACINCLIDLDKTGTISPKSMEDLRWLK